MKTCKILLTFLCASWMAGAEPKTMLVSKDMPGKSFQGALPPASPEQKKLAADLKADITFLAVRVGERNLYRYPKLLQAEAALEFRFQKLGYKVRRQTFESGGKKFTNLEATLPGKGAGAVVVGAHYDSAPNCPAANDNGSGVAALLALAARMRGLHLNKTVRWVAFANEEPPHFQTERMGSLVYARACKKHGDRIDSMVSLETIGYYSDKPGSQNYPPLFALAYPSVGNFVAFVGNVESGDLVKSAVGSFRKHASFPSEGAAVPGGLEGVGWSDHWAFWQIGVPALMVTDTAPFRYKDYHCPTDTPDKVDCLKLARVVDGLEGVIRDLAK